MRLSDGAGARTSRRGGQNRGRRDRLDGGRPAALEPALYCYHCEFCRSGRHNVCSKIRFLSTPGNPGFFREFVNLPEANLLGIPQRLSLEAATLAEPLAIGLHSMKFASVQIGETVAVFGAGPIGLVTIACLSSLAPAASGRWNRWRTAARWP